MERKTWIVEAKVREQ